MFGRESTKGTLLVAVAALFVMAFAYQAFAYSAGSGSASFAYSGTVVSIDNANRIVTVQAGPNDLLAFNLNDSGTVMKCSVPLSFDSLKIGDHVTVSYFEQSNGNFIADAISFVPSDMEHC
jgi:hypothetical protein